MPYLPRGVPNNNVGCASQKDVIKYTELSRFATKNELTAAKKRRYIVAPFTVFYMCVNDGVVINILK